jgi:hypothetical protein
MWLWGVRGGEGEVLGKCWRDVRVERHGEEGREDTADPDGALPEDTKWNRRAVLLVNLYPDKHSNQQPECQQRAPNPRVPPRVREATPLQRQQQRHNGANQEQRPNHINLLESLPHRHMTVLALGVRKEEEDDGQRHTAERQVDPKAPPPGQAIGKGAPQDRSHDTRDAKHGSQRSNINSPPPQRNRKADNRHAAREQRRSPRASDCTPDDEHGRARSRGAHDRAGLEQQQREEVRVLYVKVGVDFAKSGLQRARG